RRISSPASVALSVTFWPGRKRYASLSGAGIANASDTESAVSRLTSAMARRWKCGVIARAFVGRARCDPPPNPPPQGGRDKLCTCNSSPSPLEGEGWGGGCRERQPLMAFEVIEGLGAGAAAVERLA